MKSTIIGVVLVITLSAIVYMYFRPKPSQCTQAYSSDITIKDGLKTPLYLEQSDTELTRQKGLSSRECIPDQNGMLFIFDSAELHGIWMKDMKFSIDIIWLDTSKKVIHIEPNASPESYPKVFYPQNPASFVIEVKAGQVVERSIKVGQQLNW